LGTGLLVGRFTFTTLFFRGWDRRLPDGPLLFVLAAVGVLASAFLIVHWRRVLFLPFFLLVIDGFFTLLTNSAYPQLAKDWVLACVYVGFLRERGLDRTLLRLPVVPPLICLAALGLLQAFNPNLPGFIVGLLGLKVLLFYAPLFFVAAEAFASPEELQRFLRGLLLLSIPICILGIWQSYFGAQTMLELRELRDQPGSPAFWRAVYVTPSLGEGVSILHVRPFVTFSFPSLYAHYVFAMVCLATGLGSLHDRPGRRIFYALAFPFLVVALYTSGQRGVMLLYLLIWVFLLLGARAWPSEWKWLQGGAAVLIIGVILSSRVFYDRFMSIFSGPITQANLRTYLWINIPSELERVFQAPLFGAGTGSGAAAVRWVSAGVTYFENYYAKVAHELSLVGLIVLLWLLAATLLTGAQAILELREGGLKGLGPPLLGYVASIWVIGFQQAVLDLAVPSIYFWFFLGALVGLSRLSAAQPRRSTDEPARTDGPA